jgi:hypothetical protein
MKGNRTPHRWPAARIVLMLLLLLSLMVVEIEAENGTCYNKDRKESSSRARTRSMCDKRLDSSNENVI